MRSAMRFSGLAAGLVFPLTGLAAEPQAWTCRNTDMEVVCANRSCTAETKGAFTPMNVVVSPQEFSVCAYSGCWEGKPLLIRDGELIYAHSRNMKWSHDDQLGPATFQIALNRETRIAVLLGEGYAHPMHCEADGAR